MTIELHKIKCKLENSEKLQVFMTIDSVCSKKFVKNLKTTLEIDSLITF